MCVFTFALFQDGRGRGVGSVVGTETRYSSDGSRFESQWDSRLRLFHTGPGWPWDSPSLLYNAYRGSLPGVKRPGFGVGHLSHLLPRFTLGLAITLLPHRTFKE